MLRLSIVISPTVYSSKSASPVYSAPSPKSFQSYVFEDWKSWTPVKNSFFENYKFEAWFVGLKGSMLLLKYLEFITSISSVYEELNVVLVDSIHFKHKSTNIAVKRIHFQIKNARKPDKILFLVHNWTLSPKIIFCLSKFLWMEERCLFFWITFIT